MKFSLKFKILAGTVALLSVCTLFNLVYSYRLFVEDKTSYIYESTLKKAENISDQINFKMAELNSRLEVNSLLFNSGPLNFEKLINSQNDLIMIGSFEVGAGSAKLVRHYINTKNINLFSSNYGVKSHQFLDEIHSRVLGDYQNQKQTWIFTPAKQARFLVHLSRQSPTNVTFAVLDLNPLLEIFYKDKTYLNQIISLSSPAERAQSQSWTSSLDFNKNKKGVFSKKIGTTNHLVAYVFVNDKILILSSINEDSAFGITKFLVFKTTLFAGFLLSLAVIGGIYFSSSITFPIKLLTGAANKIAAGDFSASAPIKTTDEIKILGETFNFMSAEIQALLKNKEDLIAQLEDYSKNLEEMVAQRTGELKEANDFMSLMVNSLDQGLLVFDRDLKCHPMFTKACEPIFGVSPLNKSLPEVLGITDEDKIQGLKQWATLTFGAMIPFESAINLGPRNKITGRDYNESNYKFVQLDYYPMEDAEDNIANIVLIATDKTNEVQATEKFKQNESYVAMILKILKNKSQFESFINEVNEIFEQFHSAYSLEKNTIEFDLCMMLFHTLNGGFGIYSITSLQQMAREYESELSNIKDSCPDPSEYIPFIESHVENLKLSFLNFRKELDELIGTKFASNTSFAEIPREKILALYSMINQFNNNEMMEFFSENFVKTPIKNYFKAYDDLCKTTAVKIGKEFNGLSFNNEDLLIEPEHFEEFFNVLVHLFRNCLDHGLEDPYTRQSQGKSADGKINVSFELLGVAESKSLSVCVRDDGAGIDPQKIRARYMQLRPDADLSHLKDEEVIYKIFDPFFSTRDEVSALSGRGVGMSAIKEVVDKLHGTIEVQSTIGKGTTFTFVLPMARRLF